MTFLWITFCLIFLLGFAAIFITKIKERSRIAIARKGLLEYTSYRFWYFNPVAEYLLKLKT